MIDAERINRQFSLSHEKVIMGGGGGSMIVVERINSQL